MKHKRGSKLRIYLGLALVLTSLFLLYVVNPDISITGFAVLENSSSPVFVGDKTSFIISENIVTTIELAGFFYSNTSLTYMATSSDEIEVNIDDSKLTLTPAENFTGTSLITLIVSDGVSTTRQEVNITVESGISSARVEALNSPMPVDIEVVDSLEFRNVSDVIVFVKKNELDKLTKKDNASFVITSEYDYELTKEYKTIDAVALKLTRKGFEKLKKNSNVEAVFYDKTFGISLVDSIPLVNANNLSGQGSGVSVCILDTGANLENVSGYNFVDDNEDISDNNGHGTMVSDIILSVASESSIIPVKVCDDFGVCKGSDVLAGLDYCVDINVSVISGSLGDKSEWGDDCPTYFDSVLSLANKRLITSVFAAGNDKFRSGINYPACSEFTISVGASTKNNTLATFSNLPVDILAPGLNINTPSGTLTGTSASTPFVSAAVSLIREINKTLSPSGIKRTIIDNSKPLTPNYKLLNVQASLNHILEWNQTIEPPTINDSLPTTNDTLPDFHISALPTQDTPWSGAHQPTSGSTLDPNLVSYWQFEKHDNTTNTAIDAMNRNNGTLSGPPTWTHDGRIGSAYSFDGVGDYVGISYDDSLNLSNGNSPASASFGAWIKSNLNNQLASSAVFRTNQDVYGLSSHDNDFFCVVNNITGNIQQTSPTNSQYKDQWKHHMCVLNTTHLIHYIDGVKFSNSPFDGTLLDTFTTFYIGYEGALTRYFNGSIDEVMIFNRSLSSSEIMDLYLDGVPTNDTANITTDQDLSTSSKLTTDPEQADIDIKRIYNWYVNGSSIAVLNMPFEGGSKNGTAGGVGNGTVDYSVYHNNGTLFGVNWTPVGGIDNKGAYMFDGVDDHINISDRDTLDLNLTFSIGMWIKLAHTKLACILSKYSNVGEKSYLILELPTGGIQFLVSQDGSATYTTPATANLNVDEWYHLIATYDGTTQRVYLNGQENKTQSTSLNAIYDSSIHFELGKCADGFLFNGTIDEVQIFNHTLSPEQIQALYHLEYNRIVSNETSKHDSWYADVTLNDGSGDSVQTYTSPTITVNNSVPTQSTIIFNSTYGQNITIENITVYNQSFADTDNDALSEIINWYRNGDSITVLNMPFEGGSLSGNNSGIPNGARDYSPSNKHGTVYNVSWNNSGGVVGGAYEFNGTTDYIEEDSRLVNSYPFSLSAWMKTLSKADFINIVTMANSSDGSTMYGLQIYSNVVHAFARNPSTQDADGTTAVNDGSWHYVVGVFKNSTYREVYVDGISEGVDTVSQTYNLGVDRWSIGRLGDSSPGDYFNGTIDEVKVYNITLTPEQILAFYRGGKPNHDTITSSQTKAGEEWYAKVWANDKEVDSEVLTTENITINSCGNVYGSARLYENINSSGTCFTIGEDSAVFDCQGYTIMGNGTASAAGDAVDVVSVDDVTVKNCDIKNFYYGIKLSGANENLVQNNTMNNTYQSMFIISSTQNVITQNKFNYSSDDSIKAGLSVNNNFTYNEIRFPVTGIDITFQSDGSIIENNIITDAEEYGIHFDSNGEGSLIQNNTITNATRAGISVSDNHNILLKNTVIDSTRCIESYGNDTIIKDNIVRNCSRDSWQNFFNTGHGIIILDNFYNVTIINNSVYDNTFGITLEGHSFNTVVRNNTIVNNTASGIISIMNINTTIEGNILNNNGNNKINWTEPIIFKGSILQQTDSHNFSKFIPANVPFLITAIANLRSDQLRPRPNVLVYNSSKNSLAVKGDAFGSLKVRWFSTSYADTYTFFVGSTSDTFNSTSQSIIATFYPFNFTAYFIPIKGGIDILNSFNETIINQTINSSAGYGLRIFNVSNMLIENSTFINNSQSLWAYQKLDIKITNTTLNSPVIFESDKVGQINFTNDIPITTQRTIKDIINITNNSVYVKSTSASEFNTTARITIKNITVSSPHIFYDLEDDGVFELCPPSICTKLSFASANFSFNTTHFTTYKVSEVGNNCLNVTSNINLSENIAAGDSCFKIGADNIVIDCQGFNITGNDKGTAINLTDREGVTIKSCEINKFTDGIITTDSNSNNLTNITITDTTIGILLNNTNGYWLNNNTFTGNTYNFWIIDEYNTSLWGDQIENPIIESTTHGSINYTTTLTLNEKVNLDSATNFSNMEIFVNSSGYASLNKSASLLFRDTSNFAIPGAGISTNNSKIYLGCSQRKCTVPSNNSALNTISYNVTSFTYYTILETAEGPTGTDKGGALGTPGIGGATGIRGLMAQPVECVIDEDCPNNEKCINNKCQVIFDIQILRVDSLVRPGESLDFTYLMKSMSDMSGDVTVEYWLQDPKTQERILRGQDVLYMDGYQVKIQDANLYLYEDLRGKYELFVKLSFKGYSVEAIQSIEVKEKTPTVLTTNLLELNPPKFRISIGTNRDYEVPVTLEEIIRKDNKIIWETKKRVEVTKRLEIEETLINLDKGTYELTILTEADGDKNSITTTFTLDQPIKEQPATIGLLKNLFLIVLYTIGILGLFAVLFYVGKTAMKDQNLKTIQNLTIKKSRNIIKKTRNIKKHMRKIIPLFNTKKEVNKILKNLNIKKTFDQARKLTLEPIHKAETTAKNILKTASTIETQLENKIKFWAQRGADTSILERRLRKLRMPTPPRPITLPKPPQPLTKLKTLPKPVITKIERELKEIPKPQKKLKPKLTQKQLDIIEQIAEWKTLGIHTTELEKDLKISSLIKNKQRELTYSFIKKSFNNLETNNLTLPKLRHTLDKNLTEIIKSVKNNNIRRAKMELKRFVQKFEAFKESVEKLKALNQELKEIKGFEKEKQHIHSQLTETKHIPRIEKQIQDIKTKITKKEKSKSHSRVLPKTKSKTSEEKLYQDLDQVGIEAEKELEQRFKKKLSKLSKDLSLK